MSYPVEQEATPGALVEEYPEAPYPEEQEATPGTSVAEYPEAPYPEQQEATTLPWIPEVPVNPVEAEGMPDPSDKTAASLSKALRKMQAESAVLQEHSRRLQEKAAMIQQQRASADQVCSRVYNVPCHGPLYQLHFDCGLSFWLFLCQ